VFWRSSTEVVTAERSRQAPEPAKATPEELADGALDTIGTILNALAEADEDEDDKKNIRAWSQHLLTQSRSPGTSVDRALARAGRDWPGARTFVSQLIFRRRDRGAQAIKDLRDAITTVTRSLGRAVAEDRITDQRAKGELAKLKKAAQEGQPEEIRRCALHTVAALATVLEEREAAWAKRLQDISTHAEQLQGRLETAEREGMTDPLTELINRRGFDLQLEHALRAHNAIRERAVLLLFDIDHFKQLNDIHGHVVGDAALRAFSHSLALSFPRSGDCVARYGGEEFAVILRGTGAVDGLRLAKRALEGIRDVEVIGDTLIVQMTASVGVAEIVAGDTARSLVERADTALYRAKHSGRDRAELGTLTG